MWATTERTPEAGALLHRLSTAVVHAPHLLDAQVGQVLRRKVSRGEIPQARALRALPALIDQRHEHTGPLAEIGWRLRHTVTFYDAMFVAVAASLCLPLVTGDQRLARAVASVCEVEPIG